LEAGCVTGRCDTSSFDARPQIRSDSCDAVALGVSFISAQRNEPAATQFEMNPSKTWGIVNGEMNGFQNQSDVPRWSICLH
jgi:hypothetical protein